MKLAVVQTNPVFGEKRRNAAEALQMMESVQADLYVLPELFASGYNFISEKEVELLAETVEKGETSKILQEFAQKRKCYIVYGFPETADGKLFNSAAIVGFEGIVGVYRKIHLFDREKIFFTPGDLPFQVFDTPFGSIGIMICFDWYFPESMRTLALRKAQLIAHPSNLVLPNCPDSMPVRCLENRVFAATANRIGTEQRGGVSLKYIGQSQITSPRGEILHRSTVENAEITVKEIDQWLADDKNLNERNHLINDRRPEFYS